MPDARAERLDDAAAFAIRLANDARDIVWWTFSAGRYGVRGGVNILGTVDILAVPPAEGSRPS